MKPSEKIKKITIQLHEEHKKKCIDHGFMCHIGPGSFLTQATIQYLDEDYELGRPEWQKGMTS